MSKFYSGLTDYGAGAVAEFDDTQAPARANYFLGVDGGGTKTHAVITDADYRVLGEGFSGASNPLRAGLEPAVANVVAAIEEACAQAGRSWSDITAACVAIAGVNHPIHYETMKYALDQALGIRQLELVTDVRAALEGALDGRPGVVVIAGTGSIAMGLNEAGEVKRSGGWGPTLSDEGSGYDIARRALRAVVASFDGRQQPTVLTERICRELGIASAADLPGVIYNSDSEAVEIASMAGLVTEAAREGDEVAGAILAEAGRELGRLTVAVIEKLGMQGKSFRIACVGSVFHSGEYVLGPLREAARRVAPAAEIGPPLFPPPVGAVKLIQKMQVVSGQ